jgi:hypothetical protein
MFLLRRNYRNSDVKANVMSVMILRVNNFGRKMETLLGGLTLLL